MAQSPHALLARLTPTEFCCFVGLARRCGTCGVGAITSGCFLDRPRRRLRVACDEDEVLTADLLCDAPPRLTPFRVCIELRVQGLSAVKLSPPFLVGGIELLNTERRAASASMMLEMSTVSSDELRDRDEVLPFNDSLLFSTGFGLTRSATAAVLFSFEARETSVEMGPLSSGVVENKLSPVSFKQLEPSFDGDAPSREDMLSFSWSKTRNTVLAISRGRFSVCSLHQSSPLTPLGLCKNRFKII